jgi:chromatin assembly factor 1 subunit A
MRLNTFFTKHASPSKPSTKRLTSSVDQQTLEAEAATENPVSDYAQEFPKFFVPSHTTLAPSHRFERDHEALEHIRQRVDGMLKNQHVPPPLPQPFRATEVFHMIPYRRRRGGNQLSTKDVCRRLKVYLKTCSLSDGTRGDPQLTALNKSLQRISMKSFKFSEDVRPPYQGTFARGIPSHAAIKVCRNPFSRSMPDINYDWDSEAEWDDGEDINSDEEKSEDSEDDMADFLDDEDDAIIDSRRRQIGGDMEPFCTGIRWQEDSQSDPSFQAYRMEIISGKQSCCHLFRLSKLLTIYSLDMIQFPIDPFSTAYWSKPTPVEPSTPTHKKPTLPARTTLLAYATNMSLKEGDQVGHALNNSSLSSSGTNSSVMSDKVPVPISKGKRPFPPELLADFKQVVEGSDLSKLGLVEVLKKR